jgi:hypothetical protein
LDLSKEKEVDSGDESRTYLAAAWMRRPMLQGCLVIERKNSLRP